MTSFLMDGARRRRRIAWGFLALAALAGSVSGSPGPQPAAAERSAYAAEATEPVAVTRCAIAARCDDERRLTGVATLYAGAEAEVGELSLTLDPGLRLSGARLRLEDGDRWEPVALEGGLAHGAVRALLPRALPAGSRFVLELGYDGMPSWLDLGEGIYATDPGRSWYPRLGLAPTACELEVQAPAGFEVVVAGGPGAVRLPGRSVVAPGLVLLKAGASRQNSQVGPLRVRSRGARRISGRSLVVPGPVLGNAPVQSTPILRMPGGSAGQPGDVATLLNTASVSQNPWGGLPMGPTLATLTPPPLPDLAFKVLADFQRHFGPLPWQQVEVVQVEEYHPGVSWPGLVVVPRAVGRAPEGALHRHLSEETYFELARQWWGHAVRPGREEDRWLFEGLAEQAVALAIERQEPAAVGPFWERARDRMLAEAPPGAALASRPPDAAAGGRQDGSGPAWRALKGAFVLESLRFLMRRPGSSTNPDAAWFDALREFASAYSGKSPTTDDFQRLVERHLPPAGGSAGEGRLDWFFDQWVRGAEVPVLTAAIAANEVGQGRYRVTGSVALAGVSETFRAQVPLHADLGESGVARFGYVVLVGTTPGVVDVTVELPAKPKCIVANLYRELLTREP